MWKEYVKNVIFKYIKTGPAPENVLSLSFTVTISSLLSSVSPLLCLSCSFHSGFPPSSLTHSKKCSLSSSRLALHLRTGSQPFRFCLINYTFFLHYQFSPLISSFLPQTQSPPRFEQNRTTVPLPASQAVLLSSPNHISWETLQYICCLYFLISYFSHYNVAYTHTMCCSLNGHKRPLSYWVNVLFWGIIL